MPIVFMAYTSLVHFRFSYSMTNHNFFYEYNCFLIFQDLNNPPTTTEGLVQLWGRLDLAERLDLVRGLGGGGVDKLAGGLVAGGLLGDAITTLLAFTPTPGDVVMVVALLHALTQAKR